MRMCAKVQRAACVVLIWIAMSSLWPFWEERYVANLERFVSAPALSRCRRDIDKGMDRRALASQYTTLEEAMSLTFVPHVSASSGLMSSSTAMHVQAAACLSSPEAIGAPLAPDDICKTPKRHLSKANVVPNSRRGSVKSAQQSAAIAPKQPHAACRPIAKTPSSIGKRCASFPGHAYGRHPVWGVFDANQDARPTCVVRLCEPFHGLQKDKYMQIFLWGSTHLL